MGMAVRHLYGTRAALERRETVRSLSAVGALEN